MASAFRHRCIEPTGGRLHAAPVRCPTAAVVVLLAACEAGPERAGTVAGPRPDVPVVVDLAPGSAIVTEVAAGLPDEPLWRAADVWWREALRQSAKLDVLDGKPARDATVLRLAIDPAAHRLSAFCVAAGRPEQALAGEAFADGLLPAAIDRIAWAARLALGDDADVPVPTAACVSADALAVTAAVDGLQLMRDGALEGARRALRSARARDGASPFVLDGLAWLALLASDPAAERICVEALGYSARLSPTSQHRLARTLLLARSSQQPDHAPEHDRELLALAEAMQRERPYDPEGALSAAIAHDFLGDFAAARPLLQRLIVRMPDQAIVAYHLGWACLGTGDPVAAATHFGTAALRLPMPSVAVPRALSLYAAGDHQALDVLLARFVKECEGPTASHVHALVRMQSAHALLQNDLARSADLVLQDLNWLLAHPSVLESRAGELAEEGELLVRFGRAEALGPLLAAFQGQHPGTAVADACAYLGGLVEVIRSRKRATAVEGQLARGGDSAWSERLAAFAHEQLGEVADMHATLARAARLTDTPMTKALLARSMRAMGQVADAEALQTALRRELTTIHLRSRMMHPLLGPELAFAYRAD
jgi:hypothetical protein